MPLYEYQCESCQHRFERIQKFSDPPPEACPVCGGPVKKLLSSPAIQFKGSGFYITDYAKKPAPGGDSKSGDSKSGGSKDAASASEGGAASGGSGGSKESSGTDSAAKTSTSSDASKKA